MRETSSSSIPFRAEGFGRAAFLLSLSLAWASPAVAQCEAPVAPATPAEQRYHPGIDVLHYELLLDLPDTGAVIEGRALLTVRRTAPVDTLRLDLLHLRVDSVLVQGTSVRYTRDADRIRIPLPCGSGDELQVAVRYGGTVRDGLIVRTDQQGRWTGFGDNWPNRARYWIPSVDHPSDKATVTWIVTAPADRRVVANGVLEEERLLGRIVPDGPPRKLTRWRLDRPIPAFLMVIAAAPLAFHDLGPTACGLAEEEGCVPQMVYAAPELTDYLPGPFALAGDITSFFARLVGPFPYPRLAHLQSSTRFGGMENATAIFYPDRAFRGRTVRPALIAHEVAHQWFGNSVTPREFGHLWLSEGFASYLETLWIRKSEGDTAFRRALGDMRRQILVSSATAQRPVLDTAETDHMRLLNSNSYQKGAWVLHMLRGQVGDSGFFRGLRSYYGRHRHATAQTTDLERAMEESTGAQLGWFFDQWLRRPGHIALTTSWQWDRSGRRLVLHLEQGTRFMPYRFPLTLEIHDASGRAYRRRIEVAAVREQRVVVPLAFEGAPSRVLFDPDVELLAAFRER